jgi:hypothetical protein
MVIARYHRPHYFAAPNHRCQNPPGHEIAALISPWSPQFLSSISKSEGIVVYRRKMRQNDKESKVRELSGP